MTHPIPMNESEEVSRNVVVLDVGKTFSKLSLWDEEGKLVARESHANRSIVTGPLRSIDTRDIEGWIVHTLRRFASLRTIDTIIPVAHGAAAVIIRNNNVVCPVVDYECSIPDAVRREYVADVETE